MCYNLFTHAECAKDVVEGFLWGDLSSCYVGKMIESEAEVFGKKVSAYILLKTIDDTEEAFMSQRHGLVVTGIGDDDVGVGSLGRSGKELGAELIKSDTIFCLECLCLVFNADDGLVITDGKIRIRNAWLGHHQNDVGTLDGSEGTINAQPLDVVIGVTNACRISESEGDAAQLDCVFDGITSGALYVADNGTFLTYKGIEKCGLAYVGCTNDGNRNAVL